MQLSNILTCTLSSAVFATTVHADPAGFQDKIVGTWDLISAERYVGENPVPAFGDTARGRQILTPEGAFVIAIAQSELPIFTTADYRQGSEYENSEVVKGTWAAFGDYDYNGWRGQVSFDIEGSTFPNLDGMRLFTESSFHEDEWTYSYYFYGSATPYMRLKWRKTVD